ncbi:hypothetical protein AVEN_125066-1 [Araneus ventricosus]|uniref:Uncharacterized protein n=1 Tax=Araneus ventricosus TaxID=182803 RepID=A0A4Y2GU55_ARAVE|nr:hypothetical protein AVEN_125066-1 [Araneus ventricosus]
MSKAWEIVASYIEKHHPNKAVAMHATYLFNGNTVAFPSNFEASEKTNASRQFSSKTKLDCNQTGSRGRRLLMSELKSKNGHLQENEKVICISFVIHIPKKIEVVIRRKMAKLHMDCPAYAAFGPVAQENLPQPLTLLSELGFLARFFFFFFPPHAVGEDLLELVKEMSKDTRALNCITMHRNAASCKTRFGISKTVKKALFEDLQKEFFSLNLDKSTNSSNQKIATVLVNYMTKVLSTYFPTVLIMSTVRQFFKD